jgi:carbamoylphosphate synthase large subunit
VVASPPEVLAIAMDKWQTCRFLEAAGLHFPRYARASVLEEVERLVDEVGFPLIAKPVHGTGSRGSVTIESWGGLEPVQTSAVAMVVEEYLYPDNEEYSVEVYTLRGGRQAGTISYRRGQLVAETPTRRWSSRTPPRKQKRVRSPRPSAQLGRAMSSYESPRAGP